jgi:salicylate hydroxylase
MTEVPTPRRRILVAGGGLGGLTVAACLLKRGHDVRVFEQAPQLGEVGAGIQVSANAGRVMAHIGVADRVAEAGFLPDHYRFRTFDDGSVLQAIELGARYRATHGQPYVTIHRADLHTVLVDAVRGLRADAIETGARVTRFEEDETGVTLHFDGRASERADLVIAADGIKSVLREQILGHAQADDTGDAVWRVIVPMEDLPPMARETSTDIWVGPGRHAVTYPLRRGTLMNFVGAVEYPTLEAESWTTARPWAEMRDDFLGWNPMIGAIIEAAPRGECYRWVLKNRTPVRNWSTRFATLMGDAAHPTLPYMAQGAAMAIEDALVLARALDMDAEIPAALDRYQRNRVDRTARVVTESTENRKLFHMPSMEDLRASFAKRNMSGERNGWLFSYDPATVPLD